MTDPILDELHETRAKLYEQYKNGEEPSSTELRKEFEAMGFKYVDREPVVLKLKKRNVSA